MNTVTAPPLSRIVSDPDHCTDSTNEPILRMIRELTEVYQALANYSDAHVRQFSLTAPQFDVIAALGNASTGMTMNMLAERTLVTKGTLTGIVDRLEQKGLVKREVPPTNRRCFVIVLTPDGQSAFEKTFPAHVNHLKARLQALSPEEVTTIYEALHRLRCCFR